MRTLTTRMENAVMGFLENSGFTPKLKEIEVPNNRRIKAIAPMPDENRLVLLHAKIDNYGYRMEEIKELMREYHVWNIFLMSNPSDGIQSQFCRTIRSARYRESLSRSVGGVRELTSHHRQFSNLELDIYREFDVGLDYLRLGKFNPEFFHIPSLSEVRVEYFGDEIPNPQRVRTLRKIYRVDIKSFQNIYGFDIQIGFNSDDSYQRLAIPLRH